MVRSFNKGILLGLLLPMALPALAETEPAREVLTLNNNCLVSILNRTIRASARGEFAMPNVPSFMGRIRARATCLNPDGSTTNGQTDYFNMITNGNVSVGKFYVEPIRIPATLRIANAAPITLNSPGQQLQLNLQAVYPDNSTEDVTAGTLGTNYGVTNSNVITVNDSGQITAVASGSALVIARKDGAVAVATINVVTGGDSDGDGIPDEIELQNGLDPNDPIDAHEDQDGDGLSAIDEFTAGTGITVADTDGDGIKDGEEMAAGADGFVTNPLLADTDGDGIPDGMEVLANTDPTDGNSANYASSLTALNATPANVLLFYNTIEGENSFRITVQGTLLDGQKVNLTPQARGTRYTVGDTNVINMSGADGEVFAGNPGSTTVTVTNSGFTDVVNVTVNNFAPQSLTYIDLGETTYDLDVTDNYAYVGTASGFSIVNISSPLTPLKVASVPYAAGTRLKYNNGYLYVAQGGALSVYNVGFVVSPLLVNTLVTPFPVADIALDNNLLALATGNGGIQLYDISIPSSPVYLSTINTIGSVDAIDLKDGLLVAINQDDRVYGISVADPLFPQVGSFIQVEQSVDVALKDGVAFLAAYFTNNYSRVDFRDIAAPVYHASGAEFFPVDVSITGDFAFYADKAFIFAIPIVNVEDVDNPVFTAIIDLSRYGRNDCNYVGSNDTMALCTADTRLYINQYRQKNDVYGVPPVASIVSPNQSALIEQGRFYNFSAEVEDDVQVAAVEFWMDGQKIATDLSYPYSTSILIASDATDLDLEVRAFDTGNNQSSITRSFEVAALAPANQTWANTTLSGSSNLMYYSLYMQSSSYSSSATLETLGSMTVNGSGPSTLAVDELKVGGNLVIDGVELTLQTTKPVVINGNVRIVNGGSLVAAKAASGNAGYFPLKLVVTGDVEIDADSSIDANGAGYTATANAAVVWPGISVANNYNSATAAGSHGGLRYGMVTGTFDSYRRVSYPGNGGDFFDQSISGYGGGFVEIQARTLTLEGAIMADGDNGDDIGGAGGGIHIDVTNLEGSGVIQAAGGSGRTITQDLAGAGGRISVYVEDDSQFSGLILAYAGYNYNSQESGAGSVYIKRSNETAGHLVLDNGKRKSTVGSTPLPGVGQHVIQSFVQNPDETWTLTVSGSPWAVSSAIVDYRGYAVSLDASNGDADTFDILSNTANTLTIRTNGLDPRGYVGKTLQGVSVFATLRVIQGASIDNRLNRIDVQDETNSVSEALAATDVSEVLFGNFWLDSQSRIFNPSKVLHVLHDARLRKSAILTISDASATPLAFRVVVDHLLDVGTGTSVNVSGKGYKAGTSLANVWPDGSTAAPGTGKSGCNGGERYGATPTCAYGRYDKARFAGSGGDIYNSAFAHGGGILDIRADSIRLDGGIYSAGGNYGKYYGGAGGSINIVVNRLTGSGSINASGGNSWWYYGTSGAGGAGGRISVFVEDESNFDGNYFAGGGFYGWDATTKKFIGGAGTAYIKRNNEAYGRLIVDNGGLTAQTNSTRLRVVGKRTISALVNNSDGTWKVTVNTGTAWTPTNTSLDQGIQDLLIDLDASTTAGPYYKVISNTANDVTLEVPAGEVLPGSLVGKQLTGVHIFQSLTVGNGASLFTGTDTVITNPAP